MKTVTLSFRLASESFSLGQALSLPPESHAIAETLVPFSEQPVPYLWVDYESELDSDEIIGEEDAFSDITKLTTNGTNHLFQLTWKGHDSLLFDCISSTDGAIKALEGNSGTWQFNVRFPSESSISEFHGRCREKDISFEVIQLRQGVMRGESSGLTAVQRESLKEALEKGYFEVPRETSLKALAESTLISDSAISQRLRRGMKTILEQEFEEAEVDGKSSTYD